jgi:hypothetical protein
MTVALKTARGTIVLGILPSALQAALAAYDALRAAHGYEGAEVVARGSRGDLSRLMRGLRCLTYRGVCRIATKHSHVCPVYVRQHLPTLTTLIGLFWWNDGGSSVRERLLQLAWKKGTTK